MCFRPAEVQMKVCPKCGKVNKPVASICEGCGEPLPHVQAEDTSPENYVGPGASPAVNAPKAPAAPGAPAAPSAPTTPGAPKPPTASAV